MSSEQKHPVTGKTPEPVPVHAPGLGERILANVRRARSNILIAMLCTFLITMLDLYYGHLVNENYAFRAAALVKPGYWITFALIFIVTFSGRIFFSVSLLVVFVLSIFQIMNFEYFGSYILPIHFIQLLPDFLLILSALVEAIGEMAPILAAAGLILLLALAALIPLSRTRVIYPRAALLILMLLGSDLAGNFLFITTNREKLGEPSFKALFPDIDNLGVHNAYRSARYLAVGILPDRLVGGVSGYPSLPEPERVRSPDVNIILIMNETVRSESMSVLGYEVDTTPRLAELEGLHAASVYAAGTMTRTSFAGLVNRLKYPEIGEQFLSQSNCLFRLAKENGFKTHFIYSQSRETADTLLPYMCSNYIDSVLTSSDAPADLQGFDDSLAWNLGRIDLGEKNFILIGPRGAHTPYADKSPETFKTFDDDYDNAIHYADHVVAEIVEQVRRQSDKPAFVIMTSDHGEILKGEDEKRGHGWFKGKVVQVPFLFLALKQAASASTMSEVRKVQSHFDIATLVLGLMGYDVTVEASTDKEIWVNGSDLSGLAGQMRLHFVRDELQSVELINSVDKAPTIEELDLAE